MDWEDKEDKLYFRGQLGDEPYNELDPNRGELKLLDGE
jgi:hypothetical protein